MYDGNDWSEERVCWLSDNAGLDDGNDGNDCPHELDMTSALWSQAVVALVEHPITADNLSQWLSLSVESSNGTFYDGDGNQRRRRCGSRTASRANTARGECRPWRCWDALCCGALGHFAGTKALRYAACIHSRAGTASEDVYGTCDTPLPLAWERALVRARAAPSLGRRYSRNAVRRPQERCSCHRSADKRSNR